MKNIAVLWDLNGIIIDDMRYHLLSFQKCLRELGHDMTEEYFVAKCTGTPPNEVFADILPQIGNPISIKDAIRRKTQIYFEVTKGNMRMLPGVQSLIEGLNRNGAKQAIASGATRIEVEAIISEFGINSYFGAVVACEDVLRGKPNPEPFLTAASRLSIEPASCLVIEDGEYGIRAAKSCGMKAIGVTNTQPKEALAAADIVVDTLERVDAALISDLLNAAPII